MQKGLNRTPSVVVRILRKNKDIYDSEKRVSDESRLAFLNLIKTLFSRYACQLW
jgi:hypothetical protein